MSRPLNVLISTTFQWNPGDDFIRFGTERILKEVFESRDLNFFYYNRNPDLMEAGRKIRQDAKILSNSFASIPENLPLDLVVLAGTPEWTEGPLEGLYKTLPENLPLIALGLGYSQNSPELRLRDYEIEILKRPETLILTREICLSMELSQRLRRGTCFLPCPALFCSDGRVRVDRESREKFLIQILQAPIGPQGNGRAKEEATILKTLDAKHLTYYKNDYGFWRELSPRFISEPIEILNFLASEAYAVESSRLHGAVAGLSLCLPSSLSEETETNMRIAKAQKVFGDKILPFGRVGLISETDLWNFKREVLRKYKNHLGSFLSRLKW